MTKNKRLIATLISVFIVLTVLSLTNCSNNDTTKKTADKIIMTAKLDTITGESLEDILGIEVRKKFKERYSGHYEYYTNNDSMKVLHGQFYFSYADSGNYYLDATGEEIDDMFWIKKISYSGEFRENKKNGEFIEKLLDNDGVDLYAEWEITIDFENDMCKNAKFVGAIGHIMPLTTTYSFPNIDTCSFDRVQNLAWTEWEKEYERQKNAR
jgi:hypothetical protein